MLKKILNKKGRIAVSQILILLIGVIAISYAFGEGVGLVSALGGCATTTQPKLENGQVSFCYGNAEFGYQRYTIISARENPTSVTIQRSDGRTYTTSQFPSNQWSFSGGNPGTTGTVTSGDEPVFISLAQSAAQMSFSIESSSTSTIPKNSATDAAERAEALRAANEGPSITNSPTAQTDPVLTIATLATLADGEGNKGPFNTPTGEGDPAENYNNPLDRPSETPAGETPTPQEANFWNTGLGFIVQDFGVASVIYVSSRSILEFIYPEQEGIYDPEAASLGLSVWYLVGKQFSRGYEGEGLLSGLQESQFGTFGGKLTTGQAAGVWGFVAAAAIYALAYRNEDQLVANFECVPWQAPTGGENCNECGQNGLPCSEYQCKSLGQGCVLLNEEDSGERVCVWENPDDKAYPTIEPWENELLDGYDYITQNTGVSPPDRGVIINYADSENTQKVGDRENIGCVPTFTPLRFGVSLDESARCKIDTQRKESFNAMRFSMSNGLFKQNHSYTLSLPNSESLEAEGIEILDEEMELSIRCEDVNGNSNPANFIFKFCVDQGPDETAPRIVTTGLLSGSPISYNTSSMNLTVFVNEPVTGCKWDRNDQDYANMGGASGGIMDCSGGDEASEMDNNGLFSCIANLNGLNDGVTNRFYLKCEDLNENVMSDSYEFELQGTRELAITSANPNGTIIKASSDSVEVNLEATTSAGHNRGQSICYYKDKSDTGSSYIQFDNTDSFEHSTDIWLPEGSYSYEIKCVDLGGNADYSTIEFETDLDTSAPFAARVQHKGIYLDITTNEDAECVYDVVDCDYDFNEGIPMTSVDGKIHSTEWNTDRNFYIKCKDQFDNEPGANTCSIIVKPSQI